MNLKIIRLVIVFLTVAIMSYIAGWLNGFPLLGIDDANIYMVYMKNLANGYGFVYNPGSERVEGFTSLLWTLIGALFFKTTSHPNIFLLALNVIVQTFALWKLIQFIESRVNATNQTLLSKESILTLGILCAHSGYFEWTIFLY